MKMKMNSFYLIICILVSHSLLATSKSFKFTITKKEGTFEDAKLYCKTLEQHVVRIESQLENDELVNATKNMESFWIDYNDIQKEGIWVNSDNVPMNFKNWLPKEPNNLQGNENCAILGGVIGDQWNDIDCNYVKPIICQEYETKSKPFPITISDTAGSFASAKIYCNSFGQHIVRVESQSENDALVSVTKDIGPFWIDYNDIREEGKWVNSDNVPMKFKNWLPNEPNNSDNYENCAEMTEKWNDVNCDLPRRTICQDSENTPPKKHFTFTGKFGSYAFAVVECESLRLRLIRIDSEEDNRDIYNFAIENKVGRYWIEGIKKVYWLDSKNQILNFTKWAPNEPNNGGIRIHCIEVYTYGNYLWNEANCDSINAIICMA